MASPVFREGTKCSHKLPSVQTLQTYQNRYTPSCKVHTRCHVSTELEFDVYGERRSVYVCRAADTFILTGQISFRVEASKNTHPRHNQAFRFNWCLEALSTVPRHIPKEHMFSELDICNAQNWRTELRCACPPQPR
jgi:hypothetical protein